MRIALGDRFSQREFHDFIIEQGLLPPDPDAGEAALAGFVRKAGDAAQQ
ncbi:hypothetical protein [Rhodoferax sp.]|nr:hypothetical protein [Rhodoferax sp.]MDZ7921155.1 hypothetical protein [Rhodoferax sp.]